MATIKSSDIFIERSLHLLETNPSTTRISITYGSQSKKITKKLKDKVLKKPIDEDKSFVSFKVFDPISGELHKFKTNKLKDLSKILTVLGPTGIQITKHVKKTKKTKTIEEKADEKDKDGDVTINDQGELNSSTQSIPIRGFSSILANTEIQEEEQGSAETNSTNKDSNTKSTTDTASATASNTGSKKKSKKKGKR